MMHDCKFPHTSTMSGRWQCKGCMCVYYWNIPAQRWYVEW